MTPTRPIVRYHGGKWLLAPWIISHFPPHRVYVEPFGGGASVLLRKARSFAEIYNDLDDEMVTLFRVARDRGEDLRAALAMTPFARAEFELAYKPSRCPVERTRRTIVRAFMGFGSDGVHGHHRTGFRGSSMRSGTTPAHDWANFPGALPAIVDRLQGVVIEKRDALKVLQKYDHKDALHYVDPPYPHSTRSRVDKARGYRHELSDGDHRKLAEVLHGLSGAVILSGYSCPLYEELFGAWRRIERRTYADGAQPRTEILWLRNVPEISPGLPF